MILSSFSYPDREPLAGQGPAIEVVAADHPLAFLGGNLKFSRGV